MHNGADAAVHIFQANFDSLLGPQFRYEIVDSTAYCGSREAAVPEAVRRSEDEPKEILLYSPQAEQTAPEVAPQRKDGDGGGDDDVWVFGLIAAIGRFSQFQHCHCCCPHTSFPRPKAYIIRVSIRPNRSYSCLRKLSFTIAAVTACCGVSAGIVYRTEPLTGVICQVVLHLVQFNPHVLLVSCPSCHARRALVLAPPPRACMPRP